MENGHTNSMCPSIVPKNVLISQIKPTNLKRLVQKNKVMNYKTIITKNREYNNI